MLYAHWEGFIRKAAIGYAGYLSNKELRYGQVLDCFRGLQTVTYMRAVEAVRRRLFATTDLLNKIMTMDKDRVHLPLGRTIGQVGNLNYELFSDILELLGFQTIEYETKRVLIDETLLESRNKIAHGNYLLLDRDTTNNLMEEVIGLMRGFKTEIESAVTLKSYLKNPVVA